MTDPPGPHPSDPDAPERARLEFSRRLGYGDYLRLDTLLGAHQPLTDAHDEHLFITVHHVSELWLDLIIRELRMAMTQLAAGITPNCGEAQTNPTEGSSKTSRSCGDGRTSGRAPDVREPKQFGITDAPLKGLTRVVRAQEQLTDAWEVLKTMTPADYLQFRSAFGEASGFQSAGYRMVEVLLGNRNPTLLRPFEHRPDLHAPLQAALHAPSLYDLTLRLLAARGLPIPPEVLERDLSQPPTENAAVLDAWLTVYRDTGRFWDLYELAEKLLDVEDNFRRWRFNHLTTVERTIGFKAGSGGTSGAGYLRRALSVVLFPELWQVRTHL